jgi:hypothetical protein
MGDPHTHTAAGTGDDRDLALEDAHRQTPLVRDR